MRLQEIIAQKQLSHNKLAKMSGVSQPFISAIVAGKKQPTLPIAKRLADALGVTLDELAGYTEPPNPAA